LDPSGGRNSSRTRKCRRPGRLFRTGTQSTRRTVDYSNKRARFGRRSPYERSARAPQWLGSVASPTVCTEPHRRRQAGRRLTKGKRPWTEFAVRDDGRSVWRCAGGIHLVPRASVAVQRLGLGHGHATPTTSCRSDKAMCRWPTCKAIHAIAGFGRTLRPGRLPIRPLRCRLGRRIASLERHHRSIGVRRPLS
jgi:hypothetical protein